MKNAFLTALLSALLLVAGPASARTLFQEVTVASVAQQAGLTALLDAATAAGLADTLSTPAFVGTVLAPTNDAFVAALESLNATVEALAADGSLASILQYHILPVAAAAAQIVPNQPYETLLTGQTLSFEPAGQSLVVNAYGSEATVVQADVAAGQAIVHVIDAVLVPDLAALAPAPAPLG